MSASPGVRVGPGAGLRLAAATAQGLHRLHALEVPAFGAAARVLGAYALLNVRLGASGRPIGHATAGCARAQAAAEQIDVGDALGVPGGLAARRVHVADAGLQGGDLAAGVVTGVAAVPRRATLSAARGLDERHTVRSPAFVAAAGIGLAHAGADDRVAAFGSGVRGAAVPRAASIVPVVIIDDRGGAPTGSLVVGEAHLASGHRQQRGQQRARQEALTKQGRPPDSG